VVKSRGGAGAGSNFFPRAGLYYRAVRLVVLNRRGSTVQWSVVYTLYRT